MIANRGFSPEEMAAIVPVLKGLFVLLVTRVSAYKRGFDSIVQCCTGLVYEHSEGREPPIHVPAQCPDYVTHLGAGAMEALRRRATEGGSWLVRVSLVQTAHWLKRLGRFGPSEDAHLPDRVYRTGSYDGANHRSALSI